MASVSPSCCLAGSRWGELPLRVLRSLLGHDLIRPPFLGIPTRGGCSWGSSFLLPFSWLILGPCPLRDVLRYQRTPAPLMPLLSGSSNPPGYLFGGRMSGLLCCFLAPSPAFSFSSGGSSLGGGSSLWVWSSLRGRWVTEVCSILFSLPFIYHLLYPTYTNILTFYCLFSFPVLLPRNGGNKTRPFTTKYLIRFFCRKNGMREATILSLQSYPKIYFSRNFLMLIQKC